MAMSYETLNVLGAYYIPGQRWYPQLLENESDVEEARGFLADGLPR